jgi:hypothetical protein
MDSYRSSDVYTGIWINWSHGIINGATLTLNRGDANLLIASLAIFVGLVGTRIWRISCFIIHQLYSTQSAQNGLYHQRQALLRNSPNATSGLTGLLGVLWTWRHAGRVSYYQTLPVVLYAGLIIVALTLASIFSSRITVGTDVLLSEGNCGWLGASAVDLGTGLDALQSEFFGSARSSDIYSRQCSSGSPDSSNCNTLVKPQLQINVDSKTSCPFGNICRSENMSLLLDTGYLDTHIDFGLNAPSNQRLQYRRILRCSPLKTEGFSSTRNVSGNRTCTRYHYGRQHNKNYTYEYTTDNMWEYGITPGNECNARL